MENADNTEEQNVSVCLSPKESALKLPLPVLPGTNILNEAHQRIFHLAQIFCTPSQLL